MTKKSKMLGAMLAIVFIAYNVVLFLLCGFTDHESTFWISWLFTVIAFGALAVSGVLLGKRGRFLRDWLFGYPIVKHSTIYIICEFIVSTIFIIFESSVKWEIAFAVQFIFLAVYLVFAISCFLAKQTIDEVHTKVEDKTRFIKLLRSDTEMLAVKCEDTAVKVKCQKLAEAVRYSDPMSSEALFELEKELTLTVSECDKAITEKNYEEAGRLCDKASILLIERNKKCKALK